MRGLRRFISHWQNWVGFGLVLFYIAVALAAPLLVPEQRAYEPLVYPDRRGTAVMLPQPPSSGTPLGTTSALNRANDQWDVYAMLVWGSRAALQFGLIVAIFSTLFGVLVGAASGYFGGIANELIMRITDSFLAFPLIAGVVLFQTLLSISMGPDLGINFDTLEPYGRLYSPSLLERLLTWVDPVMLAFILFSWMGYARITNSMVQKIKQSEYIQAARALGAGHVKIILRHLIPNSIAPAVVLGARDIGGAVLMQATLTFIGIGGDSLWGRLLLIGRRWIVGSGANILNFWWVFFPATLALVFFGIGWNLLGDGLNDWLNPRSNFTIDG